ncbi:MAG: esterase/lipase/thioesterase [Francisellaceae bacterium]|nr:esterase/lipase/thioesterase [Francisellaceae bacterium]
MPHTSPIFNSASSSNIEHKIVNIIPAPKIFGTDLHELKVKMMQVEPKNKAMQAAPKEAYSVIHGSFEIQKASLSLQYQIFSPNRTPLAERLTPRLPTLFYFRGTAFIVEDTKITPIICSQLANKLQCQVIVLDTRLAPQNKYPFGVDDACENLFHFLDKRNVLGVGIDTSKVAILGYSSGGNFAMTAAIKARAEGLPVCALILVSPFLDLSRVNTEQYYEKNPAYKEFENKDSFFREADVVTIIKTYLTSGDLENHEKLVDKKISPINYEAADLKEIDNWLIIAGENDRVRGDAEKLNEKCKKADLNCELKIQKGGDHSLFWEDPTIIDHIADYIRNRFTRKSPRLENQVSLYEKSPPPLMLSRSVSAGATPYFEKPRSSNPIPIAKLRDRKFGTYSSPELSAHSQSNSSPETQELEKRENNIKASSSF